MDLGKKPQDLYFNLQKHSKQNNLFFVLHERNITTEIFPVIIGILAARKVPASELAEAIEELATHVANFSINEQDYSVLLRYFSFGLHRLKSYRTRFEQEKNALFASY